MTVEINITHNLDEVIQKWGQLPKEVDEACRQIVDDVTMSSESFAKGKASSELPSGGGNYLAMFFTFLARKVGNIWEGILENHHQWAKAVEEGTSPHTAEPYGFKIPPERRYYPWYIPMNKGGWRTFKFHKGAKPFYIFRDTRVWAIQQLQQAIHYFDKAVARALR